MPEMLKTIKAILRLFADTYTAWVRGPAIPLGAAIAFYTALSLAPLLIFVLTLTGTVIGAEAVEGELVTQTEQIVGHDAARTIGSIISQGYAIPVGAGIIGSLAGLVSVVLGASVLFWQIKRALNIVWGIRRQPRSRMRGLLRLVLDRLLASGMVIGTGALLLISVVLDASLSALRQWVTAVMPEMAQEVRVLSSLQALRFAVFFSLITFAIAIIFKVLPNADIAWRDIWVGAGVTSLMLSAGNQGISWYLATWSFRSAYGAAGSLLAFLIWVYFSAQVFFFGAEFTQGYADKYGSGIAPHKDALLIVQRHRTQHNLTHPAGIQLAVEEALAADASDASAQAQIIGAEQGGDTEPPAEQQGSTISPRARRTLRYGGALAAVTALVIGVYYGIRRATSHAKKSSKIGG